MKRQCVIIANRGAGSFSEQRLHRLCEQLRAGGLTVEQSYGTDFAELTDLARTASRAPDAPLVIAAGGDGTINAVLNGLAGNNATCAILPLGTANVLALELGLYRPEQAAARIIAGESRPFTAGLLRTGERSSRFFLMTGVGLDGHVVRGVSTRQKRLFGKGAYALAAWRQVCAWETNELTVTTREGSFTCHSLFACNTARYGGTFLLAPAASIFSPTLELVAVRHSSRLAYLGLAAGLARGRAPAGDGIVRLSTDWLRLEGVKPVQADGDDWGDSPVEILTETNYARIIV